MNKHEIRRTETIQRLISAFWSFYCDHDISKITVKQITDAAGVYRSTFYLYFTDVYQMLEYLEQSILSYWENNVISLLTNCSIEELIQAISLFYLEKGAYVSILIGPNGDPEFVQKIKNMITPYLHNLNEFKTTDPMSEIKINFLISGTLSALACWYQLEQGVPAEDVAKYIQSMVTLSTDR